MERNTGEWGEKRKCVLTVIENIHYFASAPVKVCSSIRSTFMCKHKTLERGKRKHIFCVRIQYLNQTVIQQQWCLSLAVIRQIKGLMGRISCLWPNEKTCPSANGIVQVWNESPDLSNTHSQIQTHTSLLVWVKLSFNLYTAEFLLKKNQSLREAIHLSV